MSARAKRLARLVRLRDEQHAVVAGALRAAHARLHAVESVIDGERASARDASLQMQEALLCGDSDGWILSCAAKQMAQMGIALVALQRDAARMRVADASAEEAAARCELEQMECVLGDVRRADARLAARKEQAMLDEAARLLRMHSSNPFGGRRFA